MPKVVLVAWQAGPYLPATSYHPLMSSMAV